MAETKLLQCKQCGAELDFETLLCPYCPPAGAGSDPVLEVVDEEDGPFVITESSPLGDLGPPVDTPEPEPDVEPPDPWAAEPPSFMPAAAPPPKAAPVAPQATEKDRLFGLLLFEAEEQLARGNTERALIAASKAVKEQPASLTAQAIYERARRDMLKGRRREKLEARVREAERLARVGDDEGAGKIVVSALKLIPDHALALALYAQLRERRLSANTAEAEAERELETLVRQQAQQALSAARTALASRRERQALVALRRGLRLVPDDPGLLAVLNEVNAQLAAQDAARIRHGALRAQVRAGRDLLAQGQFEEAERVLKAVVAEDPENGRALASLEQARRRERPRAQRAVSADDSLPPSAPLIERPVPPPSAPAMPPIAELAAPEPVVPEPVLRLAPEPAPVAPAAPPRAPAPVPSAPQPSAPAAARREVPAELRTVPHAPTPMPYILGGAAVLALPLAFFLLRSDPAPTPPATAPATSPVRAAPTTTVPSGPLAGLAPEVRTGIERILEQYALALESRDADRMQLARPDLTAAERDAILAPLRGAISVTTDLRILDVAVEQDGVVLTLLREDTLVGGNGQSPPRQEETLRAAPVDGRWQLVRR
jgi:tetratricopeptide (TPR) repeat protein